MSLENFRAINLKIDRANGSFLSDQFAKTGDYNGRRLVVQLSDAGVVGDLTGVDVNLGWQHDTLKNTGLDPFDPVDLAQGIFEIYYPKEMLNNGNVTALIQIIENDHITETKNFKIKVEKSVIDEDTIVSENSFTVLQDALLTVNRYDSRIANVENSKVDKSTFEQSTNNLAAQLQHKIGNGVKAEPEDLSATTLGLVTGTGGPINLLSVPQDKSVTLSKINDTAISPSWNRVYAQSNGGVKGIYVEKIFDIEPYRTQMATVTSNPRYLVSVDVHHSDNVITQMRVAGFVNNSPKPLDISESTRFDGSAFTYTNGTKQSFVWNPHPVNADTDSRYFHVLIRADGETDLEKITWYFKNLKLHVGTGSTKIVEITAPDVLNLYLCTPDSTVETNSFLGEELATISAVRKESKVAETAATLSAVIGNITTLNDTIESLKIEASPSQWNGKKWHAFGDSITWQDGKVYNGGQQNGQVARGYQTIIKEKLGFGTVTNFGQNGATSIQVIEQFRDLSLRDYDIGTFYFGTNDFMMHVPIGVYGDYETTTFFGRLDYLCKKITELKPEKPVLFITPTQRWGYMYEDKSTTMTNDEGTTLEAYVEAIKKVCGNFGFPVVDLYHNSQINRHNITTYTKDGLHPMDNGYKNIAQLIMQQMDALTV